jgi:hypothetical protein
MNGEVPHGFEWFISKGLASRLCSSGTKSTVTEARTLSETLYCLGWCPHIETLMEFPYVLIDSFCGPTTRTRVATNTLWTVLELREAAAAVAAVAAVAVAVAAAVRETG